ncbi:MAG: 4-phosphoerythronate dehydrogenase PdxB [Bacteroidales bacterium]|nr:MAG: 4-phosphoerythronate dehydrogenase PdxB [Bacteroidales bacterium]
MNIVIDDKIPFIRGVLEPFGTVKYIPGKEISRERIKDAEVLLIRTRTECNKKLLENTPVKFIASATIGYDHIDTRYCRENNITWKNAPGCNASSVKQYIASALLFLASKFRFNLRDKTLGIVGVGNVGSKVSHLAVNLGMNILLNDPPRERTEGSGIFSTLDRILEESDIISLHVPLNMKGIDRTFRMVDRSFLHTMKKGGFLINTSRGQVVNNEAIKKEFATGKLAGIVLDVWDNEPDIDRKLLDITCLGTPHIAGYSADGKANGTSMIVQAFSRFYGLELDDWYPPEIPSPSRPVLPIDCRNKSTEQIIREAILHSYAIHSDDNNLRKSPAEFEKLRGDYPLRREFQAYTIELLFSDDTIEKTLTNLGFNIKKTTNG